MGQDKGEYGPWETLSECDNSPKIVWGFYLDSVTPGFVGTIWSGF